MAEGSGPAPAPDLTRGVPLASIPEDGVFAGRVGDDAVLLVRLDDGVHAVAAHCTHYGAPLAEGRIADGRVHCPWHHACFDLRSGSAACAPAMAPLDRWKVDLRGNTVFVGERLPAVAPPPPPRSDRPDLPGGW